MTDTSKKSSQNNLKVVKSKEDIPKKDINYLQKNYGRIKIIIIDYNNIIMEYQKNTFARQYIKLII